MLTIEIFFGKKHVANICLQEVPKMFDSRYSTRMCLHFVPVETCNCYCNSLHFGTENKHEIVWK